MLFHNDSLLMGSSDVLAAAAGSGAVLDPSASPFAYNYGGTLTPGGAATPSGGRTPARLSAQLTTDVRRHTPPPQPTLDADLQQLSDWEIQPEGAQEGREGGRGPTATGLGSASHCAPCRHTPQCRPLVLLLRLTVC
jgi:hypothetical protein